MRASVLAWSWSEGGLTAEGPVRAAGVDEYCRILAVVPPAPGKKTAHVVVGAGGSSELLVLSLAHLILVHSHWLEDVAVTGLAADPWGSALAVCDYYSDVIHILAWPLAGMPPLE